MDDHELCRGKMRKDKKKQRGCDLVKNFNF